MMIFAEKGGVQVQGSTLMMVPEAHQATFFPMKLQKAHFPILIGALIGRVFDG